MKTHRPLLAFLGCGLIAWAVVGAVGWANFKNPSYEHVPVDRLIHQAEVYLNDHSKSAQAHYTLARIHYLAFHLRDDRVPVFAGSAREGALPELAPKRSIPEGVVEDPSLSVKGLVDHAASGLLGFQTAARLEPRAPLYFLGQACLLEEFARYRDEVLFAKENWKPEDLPACLRDITPTVIRSAYLKTLEVADVPVKHFVAEEWQNDFGEIFYEAAKGFMALTRGSEPHLTKQEKKDLNRAQEILKDPRYQTWSEPVTPMVFSFQKVAHLEELLAPEKSVAFDLRGYGLRGYGLRERWSWVKPELGILVWDPEQKGHITSARQLFGGYSFQIFRDNGYEALAALDDNGDGVLSGHELDGMSVWFDRNGDGVSQPDEVIPLAKLGVVSISVKATAHDGIHLMNPRGLTMRDGRVLPTWDWMVTPVREERLARASLTR